MAKVEILGAQRRRRWSREERLEILAEAFGPGGCPTDVMRRYDLSSGLLYTWRRKLREACEEGFAEARLIEDASGPSSFPVIVVDVPPNRRVSIYGSAPPRLVVAALRALR